jgi:monoterpene epsilon-lactone hydrolase
VKAIIQVIKEIQPRFPAKEGSKNIIIAGDSAGGHLALLVGQKLVATDAEISSHIAALGLISPLADLSLSSPTYETNAGRDVMIAKPTCIFDIALGVGLPNVDTKNLTMDIFPPEIFQDADLNPIAGSFKGLPPVRTVVGGCEVLLGECQRLTEMVKESGVSAELLIGEGMQHIFIVADGFAPESTTHAETFQRDLNTLLT